MPGLHRVHEQFLNMPEYAWLYLDMSEYTGICVNMTKSAWMVLFHISPFPHLSYNPLSTWKSDYLFERLQETKV